MAPFGSNDLSNIIVQAKGRKKGMRGNPSNFKWEATVFRGVAARANFLSLDCPELQFPVKQMSREMAKPMVGSCLPLKKRLFDPLLPQRLAGFEDLTWD